MTNKESVQMNILLSIFIILFICCMVIIEWDKQDQRLRKQGISKPFMAFISVPPQAIIKESNQNYVLVYDEYTKNTKKTKVVIYFYADDNPIIKEGLSQDTMIMVDGDPQPVNILPIIPKFGL